jgi:hypothetical protein
MRVSTAVLGVFLLTSIFGYGTASDESLHGTQAPKVFLDLDPRRIDANFIKEEITFVNYVRDRQSADIHLMINRHRTGSGGTEYHIQYLGIGENRGRDTDLMYYAKPTDTDDQVRRGLVKKIKQGLIPYISDTPLAEFISISYENNGQTRQPREVRDRWDHWSFRIGLDGDLSVQELEETSEYSLFLSAGRVTEQVKIRIWGFMENEDASYTVEEEEGIFEEYVSEIRRRMLFASYVKSINDHWSAGGFFDVYSSTYDNARIFYSFGAGMEYDIFPYSEYTKRELRIQYRLEYTLRDYYETTVFDLDSENLLRQRLSMLLSVKEPWGSLAFQVTGLMYLHDLTKNNLRADTEIRVNVFKGLSFDLNAGYSRVRDQLSLPKEGASKDEVLLQLQELATGYSFDIRLGISFQFGTLYSNIVNPRFDMPRHR